MGEVAMAKPGETVVRSYLENRGLIVKKIPVSDKKTVDFEVYSGNNLAFYLEEKTLESSPLDFKGSDPTYNSISKRVYEAMKQFKSINPIKDTPNVLSLTNLDGSRDIQDLSIVLTGGALTDKGHFIRIHNVGRIKDGLSLIDLYLWFDDDQLSNHFWGKTSYYIKNN
jgi:hypothetical protein